MIRNKTSQIVMLLALAAIFFFSGSLAAQTTTSKDVSVVVNKALYESGAISANLNRYIDDLNRDGWNPTITLFDFNYATASTTTHMTRATDLRNMLVDKYNSSAGLAGTVFVGEMPNAIWDHEADGADPKTFPTDMYYTDMAGGSNWIVNGSQLVNSAPMATKPDIWLGRIQTHNSSNKLSTAPTWLKDRADRTEVAGLNAYFDKNHAYRIRGAYEKTPGNWVTMAFDNNAGGGTEFLALNWADFYLDKALAPGAAYESRIGSAATEAAFISRTQAQAWEMFTEIAHGMPTHIKLTSGTLESFEIQGIDPKILFANLNSCLPGSYDLSGYFSGEMTYATSMVLSCLANSKSVTAQFFGAYHTVLGQTVSGLRDGGIFGEALMAHLAANYADGSYDSDDITDLGGMNLQGDPTLRMQHSTAYRMLWNNTSGGDFATGGNWTDGSYTLPGSLMPTSFRNGTPTAMHDTAVFNNGSAAGYAVQFNATANLNRLVVANDKVTLNLAGGGVGRTLNLNSASSIYSGLTIGETSGDVGELTVQNGLVLSQYVHVAKESGTTGTLKHQGGTIQSRQMELGVGGTVQQTGGTSTIGESLVFHGNGAYQLQGGSMEAARVAFDSNTGAFRQSGGASTVHLMDLANGGRYEYTGGTLAVGGWDTQSGGTPAGELDFTGKTVAMQSADGAWLDYRLLNAGVLKNSANVSFNVGANSVSVIPAGANPASIFVAGYSNAGVVYQPGSTLSIPTGKSIVVDNARIGGPVYNIDDQVQVAGSSFGVRDGDDRRKLNLNAGLMMTGSSTVQLGSGELKVNDNVSGMDGGSLKAGAIRVGTTVAGSKFNQTSGDVVAHDMYIGASAGTSDGTYAMGGGTLNTRNVTIGATGKGVLQQSGGTHTTQVVNIGTSSTTTAESRLELTAAAAKLVADWVNVGKGGNAAYVQNDGTATINHLVTAKTGSGASLRTGNCTLNGGTLTTGFVTVASGTTFTQNGGTHKVMNSYLEASGANMTISGTYQLNDGLLSAYVVNVGSGGRLNIAKDNALVNNHDLKLTTKTSVVTAPTLQTGGNIAGIGTINANVVMDKYWGALQPGVNGIGTLTINGSLSLDYLHEPWSVFDCDYSGTANDLVDVNGLLDLQEKNTCIMLKAKGISTAPVGDLTIFTFEQCAGATDLSKWRLFVDVGDGNGYVTWENAHAYIQGNSIVLSTVPEPASALLLGLGGVLLLRRRKA